MTMLDAEKWESLVVIYHVCGKRQREPDMGRENLTALRATYMYM